MTTIPAFRNHLVSLFAASAGLLVLAGCVSTAGNPNFDDYATSCMFEVNPTGSITWSSGDTEVTSTGGAPGDAAAMNACIRAKAAAAGDDLSTGAPTGVTEVEAVEGTVVETFTYGQPPAAPVSSKGGATEGKSCRTRNVLSGGSAYNQCNR